MSDKAARREALDGPQRRVFPARLEVRKQSSGQATLDGYASVTETPYEMYDWLGTYTEVISHGAFAKTLSESPKVQLLVNHGGMSLSATTAGSLALSEDTTGLHFEAQVNTERSDARDLVLAVEDGAVDECSFAFRIVRKQWSPDYDELRIDEINLNRGDVSCVNLGANPATSVSARSFESFLEHLEGDALRAAHGRLAARIAASTSTPGGMSLELAKAL